MLTYRKATLDDAVSLSSRLRPEDATEVALSSSESTEALLVHSVSMSQECYAAEVDGLVIALWGVHRYQLVIGVPWLLASPEVSRYAKRLVADGRAWVDHISITHPVLTNFVHAGNKSSLRWLKHLGFTIGQLYPEYGVGKAPFYQFYKHSPYLNV